MFPTFAFFWKFRFGFVFCFLFAFLFSNFLWFFVFFWTVAFMVFPVVFCFSSPVIMVFSFVFVFFSFPRFFCFSVVRLCCVSYLFFLFYFFLVFSFFLVFCIFWSFLFCLAVQAKLVLWVFLAKLPTICGTRANIVFRANSIGAHRVEKTPCVIGRSFFSQFICGAKLKSLVDINFVQEMAAKGEELQFRIYH